MIVEKKIGNAEKNLVWIPVTVESEADRTQLKTGYGLTDEILTYVTDENERSHYDRDDYLNTQLFVFHVPTKIGNDSERYITRPVTFLLKSNQVFSFTSRRTKWVNDYLAEHLTLESMEDTNQFVLLGLFMMFDQFLGPIRQINIEQNRLDKQLNQAPDNKDLIALSNLEQSLAYFISATKNNAMMVTNLSNTPFGKQLSDSNNERLADAIIEANQASEMTAIEADVVDRISNTFNNVLNNNLNDTMKFLTIWSLVLTIPTIITGYLGMNVRLPFATNPAAWAISIGVMALLMALVALWLRHRHFW